MYLVLGVVAFIFLLIQLFGVLMYFTSGILSITLPVLGLIIGSIPTSVLGVFLAYLFMRAGREEEEDKKKID